MKIILIFTVAALLALATYSVLARIKGLTGTRNAVTVSVLALLAAGLSLTVFFTSDIESKNKQQNSADLEAMVGAPAPDFEGVKPDGSPAKLSDYLDGDGYVLLDFWASWCGPCKASEPIIRGFVEKYSTQGLTVIGVNCNDKMEDALKTIEEDNMTWDIIITEKRSAVSLYNCTGIPSCYLIGPDGNIVIAGMHPVRLKDVIGNYFNGEEE